MSQTDDKFSYGAWINVENKDAGAVISGWTMLRRFEDLTC